MGQRGQQPKFAVAAAEPQRDSESQVIRPWLARAVRHQRLELGDQVMEAVTWVAGRLLLKPADHLPGPLVKVGDPRCHALRVQQHARDVDRGREQLRGHAVS
jgi:hypothetical protein